MAKDKTIYTCFECPYFYAEEGDRYATKHCGQNHLECPYYWDKGQPLGIKYDEPTKKWFRKHIGQQTTVCKCDKCNLFYKPSLGHKCKGVE